MMIELLRLSHRMMSHPRVRTAPFTVVKKSVLRVGHGNTANMVAERC